MLAADALRAKPSSQQWQDIMSARDTMLDIVGRLAPPTAGKVVPIPRDMLWAPLRPSRTRLVTSPRIGYASRPNG